MTQSLPKKYLVEGMELHRIRRTLKGPVLCGEERQFKKGPGDAGGKGAVSHYVYLSVFALSRFWEALSAASQLLFSFPK